MQPVSIARAGVAHPEFRLRQEDAATAIATVTGEPRKVRALARGTHIRSRALALPPDEIRRLGSIQQRNGLYAQHAPSLALTAARSVLAGGEDDVRCLVTSSCTGYMVPGWDVRLVQELPLRRETARLPITEAGCAAGVLALARAADYLRTRPRASALVVASEVCSLAFQPSADEGNLTSALIFADGAGAALLSSGGSPGSGSLEVVDSATVLTPAPPSTLGFGLSDHGFYPLLGRELVSLLPAATRRALALLLGPRGLTPADIAFWLLHPGGPRILGNLERCLSIDRCCTRWSWDSMAEFGNTSSAAIFDVLRRFLADPEAPTGWGIVAAFGPGVSVELLLVRRC